jgi:hypothetical protein
MKLFSFGDGGYLLLEGLFAASGGKLSQLSLKAGSLIDGGGAGVSLLHSVKTTAVMRRLLPLTS